MRYKWLLILAIVVVMSGCSLAEDYWVIKDIYVSAYGSTLTYGLAGANALDSGLAAYCYRMGIPTLSSSKLNGGWETNSLLDANVRKEMEDGFYDYSYVVYSYNGYLYFTVNRRMCGEYATQVFTITGN